jgi:hypothetical protein
MFDLASFVTSSNYVPHDDLLQIYVWMSLAVDGRASMKLPYPTEPRRPRKPIHMWSWTNERKGSLVQLSQEGTVATHDSPNWNRYFI